ncbi:MAG: translation initiation factor IF-5A [Candidatus ainarchaeum sp.]|nr:translation initiation factor IF-5A [Candidatus ainarchaeum sp.]MDD3975633.1 translation initiation factor IF-5A [Candidatus ainarchaeum sp.]
MSEVEFKFGQAGQLKIGGFVIIDDVVCKIDTVDKSKPGKHGAAKIRITATGVFNGKKMNLLKPGDADVKIPVLEKGNAQIIADLGEKYQIMDANNYQTYEVDKRDFKDLNAGDNVEYTKSGILVKIVRKKADN